MNGPERSSDGLFPQVHAREATRATLCSPGKTVIMPVLASKRAGKTEADIVVAVVGLVVVAVG